MTQREAFEAWKKINNALGYGLSRNNTPGSDLDGYEDAYTQGQWVAWRAAQPERAPLIPCRCFDEVSKRLCADKTRCSRVEAHGIKQGGQHD